MSESRNIIKELELVRSKNRHLKKYTKDLLLELEELKSQIDKFPEKDKISQIDPKRIQSHVKKIFNVFLENNLSQDSNSLIQEHLITLMDYIANFIN